jgi:hypothetical protein
VHGDKLHGEVVRAMADPTLGRFIASETVKWREIIAQADIKLDP